VHLPGRRLRLGRYLSRLLPHLHLFVGAVDPAGLVHLFEDVAELLRLCLGGFADVDDLLDGAAGKAGEGADLGAGLARVPIGLPEIFGTGPPPRLALRWRSVAAAASAGAMACQIA